MPQNGFHGLVGLTAARWVAPRAAAAAAEPFTIGVVLGAMLPDIDLYPTAIAFLIGRDDLIYVIHRSLTHSLLAILLVAALGAALWRRSAAGAWACWGLALGMLTHDALDIFFWLAQIDLFWPLSHLPVHRPLLPPVNLWKDVKLPTLFGDPRFCEKLREAFEFAAFALYLMALRRIVGQSASETGERRLRAWARWAWVGFAVALIGAVVLSYKLQEVLVNTPYLLALAPFCWLQTWRLRGPITRWARGKNARGSILEQT